MLFGTDRRRFLWDLKQRNFFCGHLKLRSLSIRAGKRSTAGCVCRDSLCIESAGALLSLPMSLSSGSRRRGGEWVTYLDLLNSFHQWQKSNYLPGNARLLYYSLLAIFNEARWPEQVQIDNFRLMSMLDTRTERVAIAARDSLVAAGLIEYSKGKKRSPNTYRLKYTPQKVSENDSESGSVFDSETVSTSSSVSVPKAVSHIKKKNKDISLVPSLDGTKRPKQVFEHDSLPYRAARWLADQIEERLPNCTAHSEATLQSWAADFDKCHRLDGHSWEDIDKVLQFSQFDSFWQSNILSGGKFRKQYTQLLAKMGGGGT